jgi:hypothetical protein
MKMMRVLILMVVPVLPLSAQTTYTFTAGTPTRYNYAAITENQRHFSGIVKSCVGNGTTATVVNTANLLGVVGHTLTISGTGTVCDGTFTITGGSVATYTFALGTVVNYVPPNDQGVSIGKKDSTHYRRWFREGTTDAHDAGIVREQTSSDGITWATATTIFSDNSGACAGRNYDLRPIAGGVINGEYFLFWSVYCWSPGNFVEVDWASTSGGVWGASQKLVTAASPTNWHWIVGSPAPFFTLPNGGVGVVMEGCASGGNCQTVPAPSLVWIIATYDNGATWGNTGTPGPSLIAVANGTYSHLPTQECGVLNTAGNTLLGYCRNNLSLGTLCTNTNCPLVQISSTDLGTTWIIGVTNFTPNCASKGTVATDNQVSPILVNAPSNLVTLFYGDRCVLTPLHYYSDLQAITFDPAAAIANPLGFSAPQTLWETSIGNDFGYPTWVLTSGSTVGQINWDAQQWIPLNLFQMALTYQSSQSTLTVSEAGAGSGTVTSNDGKINCSPTCSEVVTNGTNVVLTANPVIGSVFGNWAGCASLSGNQCTLTLNSDTTVTATFNLKLSRK